MARTRLARATYAPPFLLGGRSVSGQLGGRHDAGRPLALRLAFDARLETWSALDAGCALELWCVGVPVWHCRVVECSRRCALVRTRLTRRHVTGGLAGTVVWLRASATGRRLGQER